MVPKTKAFIMPLHTYTNHPIFMMLKVLSPESRANSGPSMSSYESVLTDEIRSDIPGPV